MERLSYLSTIFPSPQPDTAYPQHKPAPRPQNPQYMKT